MKVAKLNKKPLQQQTVLVVEDHEFQRLTLVRVLEAIGVAHVIEAVDGGQALALLATKADSIDTVITDLDMPTLDGLALMRKIGEHAPDAGIVLLSAVDRDLLAAVEWLARLQGLNLIAVLQKPASVDKLKAGLCRETGSQSVKSPPLAAISIEDIAAGLSGGQFEAFLQPKVRISDGQLVGGEALARWRHPRLGWVAPAAFIKQIEMSPYIEQFSFAILQSAAWAVHWLNTSGLPGRIAVNVAPAWLDQPDMAERLSRTVASLGIPVERLILEVTEGSANSNLNAALENLARLRMRGFTLSIDDFGTGFSSLERLICSPFSELKLDRSFVSGIERDTPRWFVVESVIALAHKLGLTTVAEGVETETEQQLLKDARCDYVQGYLVARPMSRDEFMRWSLDYLGTHGEAVRRSASSR